MISFITSSLQKETFIESTEIPVLAIFRLYMSFVFISSYLNFVTCSEIGL